MTKRRKEMVVRQPMETQLIPTPPWQRSFKKKVTLCFALCIVCIVPTSSVKVVFSCVCLFLFYCLVVYLYFVDSEEKAAKKKDKKSDKKKKGGGIRLFSICFLFIVNFNVYLAMKKAILNLLTSHLKKTA
jgi:Ca2+/Na+ antiporter